MKGKKNTGLLWTLAILITLSSAAYQRITGPTYPQTGKITLNDQQARFRLLTSETSDEDAEIYISTDDRTLRGYIEFKKFNTDEDWSRSDLFFEEGKLKGIIPKQPPAGKIVYNVYITSGEQPQLINEKPVVIRFTGPVPSVILVPHVILMFLAMMFSNLSGIMALLRRENLKKKIIITVVTLFAGGLILGPVVQKYAFGELWTGWPIGHDLTDNKTLVAFIFWIIALFTTLKNKKSSRTWIIAASVVLLLMYLIPHSMWGSELDYSTGTIQTGNN